MSRPFVTIGMPALNEEKYIEAAITSVLPSPDVMACEMIVADGGSSDATTAIVERLAKSDPRIRLVTNQGRSQATGINLIASLAHPDATILVRADCHALYPNTYVEACVDALTSRGVASVVVPMRTLGLSCFQCAVAAAQNSVMGNGGAVHRRAGQRSRLIDHGHHAAFLLQDFRHLGGYDESFVANEDAELDTRLLASGRQIWLCGDAAISYFPRASLRALGAQYVRYGAGRAATIRKTGGRPKLRQLLPLIVTIACLVSLGAGIFDPRFTLVAAGYYLTCLLWGLVLAGSERRVCTAASGVAAIVMHHAWAFGFLSGLVVSQFERPAPRPAWAEVSDLGSLP